MTLLAIDWTVVGIKILQFILSFSILVVLHELGHFLPARWFQMPGRKISTCFLIPGFHWQKRK